MKQISIIFCAWISILSIGFSESQLFDLNDEQLVQALQIGKNQAQFEREISSPDSRKWIDRCLKNSKLKVILYTSIPEIKNIDVMDELLVVYLRDHEQWATSKNPNYNTNPSMAAAVSACVWLYFPSLKTEAKDRESLSYSLQTTEGRNAVVDVYQKFIALPKNARTEDNPKVVGLLADMRSIFTKYGTLDFLRPEGQRNPRKEVSSIPSTNSQVPEKAPSVQTTTTDQVEPPRSNLVPILIVGGVLAGLVSWLLVKRSGQK